MKKLNELYNCAFEVNIKGIKINSKEVKEGDLFVCTKGVTVDRHDFIDEAIKNGAVALITKKDVNVLIPYIKVDDPNKELPLLCQKFYDNPLDKLKLIGITGTDGKTTTATIIAKLLGLDICGYMGTNGRMCSAFNKPLTNTTPDADKLYEYLNDFVLNGCKYVAMETSSEAFYRKRLENISFDISVITNITEDHLNIHKTIKNYIECKSMLFKQNKGISILNKDDQYFNEVLKSVKGKYLTYGKKDSDLQILDYQIFTDKTIINYLYKNNIYTVKSPLLGEYNVYNLAAAILVLVSLDYEITDILKRVENIEFIVGRTEFINTKSKFKVVLDYAHTPNALKNILQLLNNIKTNRIIAISGSAGGREKEKRKAMGEILLSEADHVVFTMDDPRNEDVNEIINDMIQDNTSNNYTIVTNRKEAIKSAFDMAKVGDIVLVAGKGRDNYMALGNEYVPYSDYDTIIELLKDYQ
ncbi:MAG: UDP-N-acetylmuramoyl-L-alanyl-D-glutamate--2,6-diaminopimelate ligase [Bacilli bacterium]